MTIADVEWLQNWYADKPVKPHRNYVQTIVPRIQALGDLPGFQVEKYGSATYTAKNEDRTTISVTHDLYRILVGDFDPKKETVLIFGGTHGYEKGGPLAALGFAEEEAAGYSQKYNIVIYPCLCPGPYEKELRYTEGRIDPNRDALAQNAQSQEMRALADSLRTLHARVFSDDLARKFAAALDMHETPLMDLEILRESAEAGGEVFTLDPNDFPEGLFLIAFDEDKKFMDHVIHSVSGEGHRIVGDPNIYEVPNHGGVIYASEMGPANGRVRQLTALFTRVNFTTEYCGLHIHDKMPDKDRAEPQRAVIKGIFEALEAGL